MSYRAKMLILIILSCLCFVSGKNQPHIILILADDLGWNDVSFHGSNQIPTTNIDALAYNGIILNQHYSMSLCTPSRAALLTGKYPIHTGMQHYVIKEDEPWGLGLSEMLLPQILSKAGYKTHMVGKWHLGYHRKAYTPINRGFDSFFGFWLSHQNYYNHLLTTKTMHYGYDMRRDLDTDWSAYGQYSTDIFTEESIRLITNHNKSDPFFLYLSHTAPHSGNQDEPYQAPQDVVDRFLYIEDPERRKYAAMVAKLDESVGDVVASLAKNEMLDNSIIIFLSDNGAPTYGMHNNKGSNFPFKGMKSSAWEGGHRSVAAVWSPLIKKSKRVSNHLMHITDWFPTLCSLIGDESHNINIDGINMWDSISQGTPSPRNEMLYNIDDLESPYAALRIDDWKYVSGYQMGSINWNDWYGLLNNTNDIKYHPESVIMSKTGTEISKLNMKSVLKYAIENRNISAEKEEDILNRMMLHRDTILKLREEARIECKNVQNITCDPLKNPCIFNLKDDPCELNNLADQQRNILRNMEESIKKYRKRMVLPRNKPGDCRCNPAFWNHTYTNWSDELEKPEFQNITCL